MNDIKERKFRHELKYIVDNNQLEIIKNRISSLMPLDKHAGDKGMYNIRSLYFDDPYNRCYYENENGTDPREKFRIRIYNHSSSRIVLECKRKERGKTHKTSCGLTMEQTLSIMRGEPLTDIASLPPLLRRLTLKMLTERFHPVVIVDYDRVPYVYALGNVRVTFDTNVSACGDIHSFFDRNVPKRPVLPFGQSILEVKFDEYLPDYIYRSLQTDDLRQTAFSKYYVCRKFCLGGNNNEF